MSNWSKSVGTRPNTVRVFKRKGRSGLYMKYRQAGKERKESLGHADRKRALREAAEKHAELLLEDGKEPESVTLETLTAHYLRSHSPKKARPQADERRAELWIRFLGPGRDPHGISRPEWESFIDLRRSGAIDARGNAVPQEKRRPVGDRTIEADCKWLAAVCRWGWNRRLLREHPLRGYETPKEKNPRREVATRDRYEAVLAVADDVGGGFREIFEVVAGTGRRLSSVLQLRAEDLQLDRGPHGAIRWPAGTDKLGRESTVPIDPTVRAAIERRMKDRPIVGRAYLFPAPKDPEKPVSRYQADRWLRRAEKLAGLEPQEGTLWHAYRRKWGTERKHLPAQDVAKAGGWKGTETLKTIYQQPDEETVLRVVLEPGELREVR